MDKRKVARFYELLTHKCWNRIVNRIRDTKKWLALLQLAAYNIIYIMVMCGVLYLIFQHHSEELFTIDLVSALLLVGQSLFSISFVSLFVIGTEEAIIRAMLSRNNPHLFDELFDTQKDIQNLLMGLLSVLAILAAVFTSISDQLNRGLLFCGIILFAYIIVTWLYERLFLRAHVIEGILEEMKDE
ncbi:MAG: hypothetical protein IJV14_14215 [Lachnospiraceae bacterium]|nr:hypothetical protein [Lachnospiraceae bacterium]